MKMGYSSDYYREIVSQSLDRLSPKYRHFLKYLSSYNPDLGKGSVILDLGCGSGTLCEFLRSEYPDSEVMGVDAFELPLESARKRCPDVDFFKCDLNDSRLPVDDASVDLIVSHEVIEHLVDDSNFFEEMHRILKPGGCVLLKTPNRWDLMRLVAPCLGRRWYADYDETHVRYYSVRDMVLCLRSSGFDDCQAYAGTKPWYQGRFFKWGPWPFVGNGVIGIGRKGFSE